jgi:hypothetical protein
VSLKYCIHINQSLIVLEKYVIHGRPEEVVQELWEDGNVVDRQPTESGNTLG